MSTLSAVQSLMNIYGSAATQSRKAATTSQSADASTTAGTSVTISSAAREAAKNDASATTGFKLPDYVSSWFNKDFPQDVVDEATARLADIKTHGSLGAEGPLNLPLLPENQALSDSFRAEMKSIREAGLENATPEQSARFNLLMNLNMRLQLTGWEKPMTEADVQREFDISNVMGKLSAKDPQPAPPTDEEVERMIADTGSGTVPSVWTRRWEQAGLEMPENVETSPDRSMWLDVAEAAGIGADEFMSKLRELSDDNKGSALTRAIESFISERYVAMTEAQTDGATATA